MARASLAPGQYPGAAPETMVAPPRVVSDAFFPRAGSLRGAARLRVDVGAALADSLTRRFRLTEYTAGAHFSMMTPSKTSAALRTVATQSVAGSGCAERARWQHIFGLRGTPDDLHQPEDVGQLREVARKLANSGRSLAIVAS